MEHHDDEILEPYLFLRLANTERQMRSWITTGWLVMWVQWSSHLLHSSGHSVED